MRLIGAAAAALAIATPAAAAERGFTVTGFERLRVAGPFDVTVTTGGGTMVRAEGDARLLDRLVARVEGRTLLLRYDASAGMGANGRLAIRVAAPALTAVALDGAGGVRVDRLRGDRIDLAVAGSGGLSVGRIDAERLTMTLVGVGDLAIAGRAAFARAEVRGAGSLAGAGLEATVLDAALGGSGNLALAATRTARLAAVGSGDAIVTGPAACTVRHSGTGVVRCGARSDQP